MIYMNKNIIDLKTKENNIYKRRYSPPLISNFTSFHSLKSIHKDN